MPIPMELRRIISTINDEHIIILKEVDGDRAFPIVIGVFEVVSIGRRVRGELSPRPLTHDLILSAIEQLGGELRDVVIHDLHDNTYFAKLRVRQGGELVEIDCRPSDAIPIAVSAKVPIFVNESVLGEALDD